MILLKHVAANKSKNHEIKLIKPRSQIKLRKTDKFLEEVILFIST